MKIGSGYFLSSSKPSFQPKFRLQSGVICSVSLYGSPGRQKLWQELCTTQTPAGTNQK